MTGVSSIYSPFSAFSTSGYSSLFGVSSTSDPFSQDAQSQDFAPAGSVPSLFMPMSNSALSGDTLLSLISSSSSSTGSPATDLLSSASGWTMNAATAAYGTTLFGTLESGQYNSNMIFDASMAANLSAAQSSAVSSSSGGSGTNFFA